MGRKIKQKTPKQLMEKTKQYIKDSELYWKVAIVKNLQCWMLYFEGCCYKVPWMMANESRYIWLQCTISYFIFGGS